MFFGDHDKSIPMSDIQAIEKELKSDSKRIIEIVVYAGVGHAFTNDERPEGLQRSGDPESLGEDLGLA